MQNRNRQLDQNADTIFDIVNIHICHSKLVVDRRKLHGEIIKNHQVKSFFAETYVYLFRHQCKMC
jgi:uncharacterized HAD superfamily protein